MIGSSKNSRENYSTKCFWTQEKETRVKFNPGLRANRLSNNWAQGINHVEWSHQWESAKNAIHCFSRYYSNLNYPGCHWVFTRGFPLKQKHSVAREKKSLVPRVSLNSTRQKGISQTELDFWYKRENWFIRIIDIWSEKIQYSCKRGKANRCDCLLRLCFAFH